MAELDLSKAAPIIQEVLKKVLEQKRYPFGFAKFRGMGNKVASGKLKNSITVTTAKEGQDDIIEIIIEEYAQWVQSGRLPGKKGVPIKALEQWIKDRKLKGRDKKGRYITNKSFAFAIRNNIKKFGIRPANFYDVALEMLLNDDRVMEVITEAGYEKLDEGFEDLINKIRGI